MMHSTKRRVANTNMRESIQVHYFKIPPKFLQSIESTEFHQMFLVIGRSLLFLWFLIEPYCPTGLQLMWSSGIFGVGCGVGGVTVVGGVALLRGGQGGSALLFFFHCTPTPHSGGVVERGVAPLEEI